VRHPLVRFATMFLLGVMPLSEAYAAPLTVGQPAPPFVLKKADGKPVGLSSYKGKVVLLNFWATGAPRVGSKCHGSKSSRISTAIED
jgi:hypothetical protein